MSKSAEELRLDEILMATEANLRDHGWCQGVQRDVQGRFCLRGALLRGIESVWGGPRATNFWPAYDNLMQRLTNRTDPTVTPVIWQDRPGRTFEEVLEAIDLVRRDLKEA